MNDEKRAELERDIAAVLNSHGVDSELGIADFSLAEEFVNKLYLSNQPTIEVNDDGHTVYTIESIDQIHRLPEDKLEFFFMDMRKGINVMRPVVELTELMGEVMDAGGKRIMNLSKFMWIDDGKYGDEADMSNCHIRIQGLPEAGTDQNETTD